MTRTKKDDLAIEPSSGNVFADLGLPDAELRLAKAELANLITHIIAKRGLTQAEAATIMRMQQPDVSNLTRGRLKNFSQERLAACLNHLNFDIRIQVAEGPRWKAKAGVTVEMVPAGRRRER
ncbi:MAG: XRE family transcriptional regulator [Gemmatimonadales bacterium]|jgi:predicted XRE-type DNA-binding protein|nr:XRE family transcriptional regulator [Gemmatimonadales bacterium]MBP6571952.1 XRE family transcriptional regulator [Gemmatimonadales bacterium]MBP7620731.1 XRE family transcriptional regulator [Gemmatimonadales bacterium]